MVRFSNASSTFLEDKGLHKALASQKTIFSKKIHAVVTWEQWIHGAGSWRLARTCTTAEGLPDSSGKPADAMQIAPRTWNGWPVLQHSGDMLLIAPMVLQTMGLTLLHAKHQAPEQSATDRMV